MRVSSIYLYSSFVILWRDNVLSYHTPQCYCSWTNALKNGDSSGGQVLLSQHSSTLLCFTDGNFIPKLQRSQILALRAEILFQQLFLGVTFCPLFSNVFPRSFSAVDPNQRPLPLACHGEKRVMRLYGQQRGRLCTETAAGAAVTVAVLLLAPHCSQDEVHRCSHSVQWFIGCLKQCISVKNNSS